MQGNPAQWDEFQWEKFLRMQERRRETLMLYTLRSRNPWRLGAMWSGIQPEPLPEEDEFWNEETEGDEWKIISHPCYRDVYNALQTVRLTLDTIPVSNKAPAVVVELIARTHSIPYFIAAGLTLHFEYGCPGGAVAYLKRALNLANESLDYIKEVDKEGLILRPGYAELVRECTFARNTIGCHVSDLRHGNMYSPFA